MKKFVFILMLVALVSACSAGCGGCGCPEPNCPDCPEPEPCEPEVIEKIVEVPGPERIVEKIVEVPGPERIVEKIVEVPGPERIVEKTVEVQVPGPERIVEKIVEVPGPERIVEIPVAKCANITLRINEANETLHELHGAVDGLCDGDIPLWVNISRWTIIDSSGQVVMVYPPGTFVRMGDFPVFEWEVYPIPGVLELRKDTGEVVDRFHYLPREGWTNQRIPDLADQILRKKETFGRSNR